MERTASNCCFPITFIAMILVTGGTGLLGAHLLLELSRKGQKIRALKRSESGLQAVKDIFSFYDAQNADELFRRIEWVEGDVRDIFSLEDALKDVAYVYHCAAVVSFDPKDRDLMTSVNEKGTANLVNACLDEGVKKLCYVSSTAALGRTKNNELINEKTQWKNAPENSWYAITKYNAEREVWRGIEEGLPAVIVNPSVILGPADWNTGSSALFRNGSRGMLFYTTGGNAVVDVRDVVFAMLALMENEITEERFLVVGENLSFKSLFDKIAASYGKNPSRFKAGTILTGLAWRWEKLICRFSGRKALITKETARAAHNTYRYDHSKIKKATGMTFRSVDESIANAVKFFNRKVN